LPTAPCSAWVTCSEKAYRGVLSAHQVQNITQSESQKPTFEKINYIYETRRPKEF